MLAYLAILIVSIAGFAGAPLWAVILGAVGLASLSYAEHYRLYQRNSDLGFTELVDTTLLASLLNAFAAAAMAYGAGAALRFMGA
jgi:hypothetical protein